MASGAECLSCPPLFSGNCCAVPASSSIEVIRAIETSATAVSRQPRVADAPLHLQRATAMHSTHLVRYGGCAMSARTAANARGQIFNSMPTQRRQLGELHEPDLPGPREDPGATVT